MGHIQDMTTEQRSKFITYQYKEKKEANKGYNFQYFNQDKWDLLEKKGYEMFLFLDSFNNKSYSTSSVFSAKKEVEKLRAKNKYARIICGYDKNKQRVKMYSIIYKAK